MKTRLIKLTDQIKQTRDQTQWGPGITHTATGIGGLCTDGVIYAYRGGVELSPVLALLMNPIHGCIQNPRVWVCEGIVKYDDGTKVGCRTLTTLYEISIPEITIEQRVKFAILCAKTVCSQSAWITWADNWLSGKDRSACAAAAAAAAAYAAYAAAAYAAADAAYAAAAADAAADAAAAAAAAYAAYAAADAAAAKNVNTVLNLVELARQAMS